ncbi:MAG: cation:proton antiporter subunit C [PS1 clade bacterium]|nr:cation:proton antiporter subunit C [PS1 clade bacterium]CAI8424059.1 MAG: Na(+)/H(+) antiporter subunit C [Rhodobiaceae bacterium UBA7378]HCQ81322.1 Na+/H+ antiporter subunit C [Rhodobiaceae bacterium]|tara:strand:- start:1563 stop:1961 length:399 start_codon:yes stop_codon:yes gene_type:complete
MSDIAAQWNYYLVIILMMLGFYAVIARGNMIKKMVGLNIFQTSVFMLYISMGKIDGGTAPILTGDPATVYSNPLPHVLILTAIVVGVATTAVGYALIIRVYEAYGTIEDDEVAALIDADQDARERADAEADT